MVIFLWGLDPVCFPTNEYAQVIGKHFVKRKQQHG